MKTIRWGIIGTGVIAHKFAADLLLVEGVELIAIGSRTQSSAKDFGVEFNIKYVYDSYEGVARNCEVDVIYIATPHSLHYENTLLCLSEGKAVLCEKPFSINRRQAIEMISLAKEKEVFLMEALWTKFHPHFLKMREMIAGGALGKIKMLQVNFGFKPVHPINPRLFDPELGGGTLMDIGIYNVFMALNILGKPDHISAMANRTITGADEQCAITFFYNDGAMAQLFSSFSLDLATEANIYGTEGQIRIPPKFYEPSATIEFSSNSKEDRQIITVNKETGWGYQYEARHVSDCLRKGLTESPIVSFSDTLLLMEILDKIRVLADIHYPADEPD